MMRPKDVLSPRLGFDFDFDFDFDFAPLCQVCALDAGCHFFLTLTLTLRPCAKFGSTRDNATGWCRLEMFLSPDHLHCRSASRNCPGFAVEFLDHGFAVEQEAEVLVSLDQG